MSFLANYRIYTSGNECPPSFHTLAGLVALSSIVQRRVWVDMGPFEVFGNLYVVLVGPPGVKKSSAMNFVKDLLRQFDTVPVSSSSITPQALLRDMAQNATVIEGLSKEDFKSDALRVFTPYTIIASEMSNFLRHGAEDMIDILTGMYDERRVFDCKTKNMGTDVIEGPYVTLIAGTTPSWINTYLKHEILKGGFMRRCLFIYEERDAERIAFPTYGLEQRKAFDLLVTHGKVLQNKVSGPMKWSEEAREWYQNWYEAGSIVSDDEFVADYQSTKHMHVLRLAMLYSLSQSMTMTLTVKDLEFGLQMLDIVEKNLQTVFAGFGRNALAPISEKIISVLKESPSMALEPRVIQAKLWKEANQAELIQCYLHLEQTGRIVKKQQTLSNGVVRVIYQLNQRSAK